MVGVEEHVFEDGVLVGGYEEHLGQLVVFGADGVDDEFSESVMLGEDYGLVVERVDTVVFELEFGGLRRA